MEYDVAKKSGGIDEGMQGTGLDLVYYWNIFENPRELLCCDKFGCFETFVDKIPSIVIVRTQMIPNDPLNSDETNELKTQILEYLDNEMLKGRKDYDIYLMGARLTQTRVSEEEQGIYKIGGKYSGANSPIQLIRKCEKLNYGYSIDNPYKMSEVSDEYYYLKNIVAENGEIIAYDRIGSLSGENDGILDLWKILIRKNNKDYLYHLYFDPYAMQVFENPFSEDNVISGFTLVKNK